MSVPGFALESFVFCNTVDSSNVMYTRERI